MNKPLCIVSCALETFSGYGARSRDFMKALIKLKGEEWDIQVLSQRWGSTPFGALDTNNKEDIDLKSRIVGKLTMSVPKQPDIWFQITVPSEFQPLGRYVNVGLSAGIETTMSAPEWIDGCNRMNLTIVSSEHAKRTFVNTTFQQQDQNKRVVREGKLEKPMEVLFEGCDLRTYFKTEELNEFQLYKDLNTIPEKFCFLIEGHWLSGDFGHDRKNIGYTIKAFLEVFKNKRDKPALILKTAQGPTSILDREAILRKIDSIRASVTGDLPNIYLLHGDVTDEEINCLYNHPKVKAMISLTKGEGFGRPLLEFSIVGKPIIASGWSGQLDFLTPELSGLIGGTLENVHPSAHVPNMLLKEAQWFKPDDNQVGYALMDMFKNYKKYKEKARQLAFRNKKQFSLDAMTEKLGELLDKFIPPIPEQKEIVLPTLKRIK